MGRTVFEVRIKAPNNPTDYTPSLFKRILGTKSGPKIYSDMDGVEIQEYIWKL